MAHERRTSTEQLAAALGWFSIGLGLAEILAPTTLAKIAGVPRTASARRTMRAMGVRETLTGLAILARPGAATPLWGRVAGDAVDLALLGRAFAAPGGNRARLTASTAMVAGITALDALTAQRAGADGRAQADQPIEAAAAVTIGRSIEEVYDFWSDLEMFPRFLRHLDSVTDLGSGRSRWSVKGPGGVLVDWEAEITADQAGRRISWRSLPGSGIRNRGTVRFEHAPAARGTEVHVEIAYWPPAGELGHAAATLFGRSPRQQLREGLRRIKQLLEVGEISLSDGPGLSRPAQPVRSVDALDALVGVQS
jgi:uncharacterized membrane protein